LIRTFLRRSIGRILGVDDMFLYQVSTIFRNE
jgi:hypothetical protein